MCPKNVGLVPILIAVVPIPVPVPVLVVVPVPVPVPVPVVVPLPVSVLVSVSVPIPVPVPVRPGWSTRSDPVVLLISSVWLCSFGLSWWFECAIFPVRLSCAVVGFDLVRFA